MTFREPGGGAHRPETCPACGEHQRGKRFILGICSDCFQAGKEIPEEGIEGKPFPDPVSALAKDSKRRAAAEGEASPWSGHRPKPRERVRVLRPEDTRLMFEMLWQRELAGLSADGRWKSFAKWTQEFSEPDEIREVLASLWLDGYDPLQICRGLHLHLFVALQEARAAAFRRVTTAKTLAKIRRGLERHRDELTTLSMTSGEPKRWFELVELLGERAQALRNGKPAPPKGVDARKACHRWLNEFLRAHGPRKPHDREVTILLNRVSGKYLSQATTLRDRQRFEAKPRSR
jgi:hypothetical protein